VILLHRNGQPLDGAMRSAAEMHDGLVADFLALEERIAADAAIASSARPFIEALKGWVRANIDWSIETGRYRDAA